jgi:hypothetical protein
MAELTVKAYDREIKIILADDSRAEEWLEAFRSVMFHIGFHIDTIREYLPTSDEIEEQSVERGEYED